MSVRKYDSIQRYDNAVVALSPTAKLLTWAYENPEKALEIGAKIALVGGLIWFLGALFKK
jgi:hypothetical protein